MPDKPVDKTVDTTLIERLEIVLLARLNTSKTPPSAAELAGELARYAPSRLAAAQWSELVTACLHGLDARGLAAPDRRSERTAELKRRTGAHAVQRWQQWSERILPGLALGVRADDAKAHKRLGDRDDWSAAIVARSLRMWSKGSPPSPAALCDALIWQTLGLSSAPKRCPVELRAHYLRSHIDIEGGRPDLMLRQLAAKSIGAPRVELKALRESLIRMWLSGAELGAGAAVPEPVRDAAPASPQTPAPERSATVAPPVGGPTSAPASPRAAEPGAPTGDAPSLVDAVRDAADRARDGVFGDRKVFISSVWRALRTLPSWSELDLDEFKARLVLAHRRRELVLARADLVAAMDPALVAASETRTDGATFHFIVREPVQ